MFERIPPLHGAVGRAWVSSLCEWSVSSFGCSLARVDEYIPVVLAWRTCVTSKVGTGVATVAVLALHVGIHCAPGWVTDEHAETLDTCVSVAFLLDTALRKCLRA